MDKIIEWLSDPVVWMLFSIAWWTERRIKVQDNQFNIIMARLNELTGKEPEDLSYKDDDGKLR
ncbi:MAG: hypothetical protein COA69_05060 [Robiginitomaculum sp.]|nr:MAG: hypothetical protein COA69_05060 [Robiginitomaculum sp.]